FAANAATLDSAKSAGQIGESVDGYVHLVDENAPADVKALVKDVNNKRREKYQSIAKKRGAPVEDVATLAGAKLVERAPAGQYVMDSNAKWRKK
ncbi:MAG: YdbL family protein, partial [Myxococcota bacterium]